MVSVANIITFCRVLVIPVFVWLLYSNQRIAAAVVFCVMALSDAVDGFLARKLNQVTKLGIIIDPLADKLVVVSALVFLIGKGVPVWMAWVLICRELLMVGLRLILARHIVVPASILGKAKTVLEMGGIVMVLFGLPFSWWVLLGAVVFSVWSGFDYIWKYRKALIKEID